MQSELKTCPFCGSEKHMLLLPTCDRGTPYDPADRAFPIIRCGGCYADVPGKDFDASGKSAVDAWNRRSALVDVPAVEPKPMTCQCANTITDPCIVCGRGKTLVTAEWVRKMAEREGDLDATTGVPISSPSIKPVALIERDVLSELAKHKTATGTVCSPLFKSKFGKKVALYTSPPLSREGEDSAEVERMTRPIVGIEHRTAQEVFDIMADRIRLAATRSGSATTQKGGDHG